MHYKNRKSIRLQNWDYGSNAAYFITICTKNRDHTFGEIINKEMIVSPAGAIAHVLWYEIKNHVKNIDLGEFVVMPNHVHGILLLDGPNGRAVACNDPTVPGSQEFSPLSKNEHMAAISPKPNTVSSIIRSYKSAVTRYCHQLGLPMAWQARFHDHIIRNNESYLRISAYIKNNPANWQEDKFH